MSDKKAKGSIFKGIDFLVGDDGIRDSSQKKGKIRTEVPKKPEKKAPSSSAAPSLSTMGGVAKAARLLLALGSEQASIILRELDQPEIEQLIGEMSKIPRIDREERESILAEFDSTVNHIYNSVQGGVQKAEEILSNTLGKEKAEEIMSRLHRQNLERDFEFLESIEPPVLSAALAEEHPQVIAVSLSCMKPRTAALILKHFSPALRTDVSIRIARTSRTHPDAVQRVAKVLREKFEKRREEIYSDTGGAEVLAGILNHMDRSTEDSILNYLDKNADDVYGNVKALLYTFEELINLELREMRFLLSKVSDDFILSSALRGAGEELRRHFFNALSQNRAADILEEIERRGAISIREINDARSYVLNIARKLDETGEIVIKKEKEEYV